MTAHANAISSDTIEVRVLIQKSMNGPDFGGILSRADGSQ